MIKPLLILCLVLPFLYLGYKSLDLAVYKRQKKSSYGVKESPVFLIGLVMFVLAGIIIANYKTLLGVL